MQLIKLELEGFGKFATKKTINFKEGINFIGGLNEVGKSTIIEAILASIFKFTTREIEPFFCWKNADICETALTYKTDNGKTFRITTDHKNNKRKLVKITKRKNKEIASVNKNISPYLKKHFGFDDKKVFENTAFIRQSQMTILENHAIKNKIKDMIEEVFAGRAKASATKALSKIKKITKDSSKEIDILEDEQRDLKEKLKNA
ncbi:MAG: AAA family ATPase, partial [Nanoarchaeota archaeon]|nr:AAA family ATPase [Nanoarchaeota archaeon]